MKPHIPRRSLRLVLSFITGVALVDQIYGQQAFDLKAYQPSFEVGIHRMQASFDGCRMSVRNPESARLWFDGRWTVFMDQKKSKKISAADATVVQSRVSWSIESPKNFGSYWLWISCDPPDDPLGLPVPMRGDSCSRKNWRIPSTYTLQSSFSRDGMKGRIFFAQTRKNAGPSYLGFCVTKADHTVVGGGEFRNKEVNKQTIMNVIHSLSVDN